MHESRLLGGSLFYFVRPPSARSSLSKTHFELIATQNSRCLDVDAPAVRQQECLPSQVATRALWNGLAAPACDRSSERHHDAATGWRLLLDWLRPGHALQPEVPLGWRASLRPEFSAQSRLPGFPP